MSRLAVPRGRIRGAGLARPGLRVAALRVASLRLSALPVAWLAVSRLGVPARLVVGLLAGGRRRLRGAGRRLPALAAEAQARQAVLGLVSSRTVLLLQSGLLRLVLLRYGPGGAGPLGAGPLITRGRDYPGALR